MVTVLARIESVSISDGSVRIITGFPVPLRPGSSDAVSDPEEFVECAGTWIPDGFRASAVDPADPTVAGIRLELRPDDVTRIVVRLKPSAVAPRPVSVAPVREATLTLTDVLTAVEANYPKLQSADATRLAADAKLTEKAGAFDPIFFGDSEYVRYNNSSKPGTLAHYFAHDVGIEFPTPLGLKVYAGARMTEGKVKSPLSPTSRDGEYFFGLKLPLLRGLGINEKAAQLRQARLMLPQADAEFQAVRLETLQKAAVSYWDWSAAGERLRIARALLSLADVRARAVSQEVDAGARAGIELVEATQEVQRRTEALRKAERDLQKEAYKLSLFLWDSSGGPAGVPTEPMLPKLPPPAGPLDAAVVTQAEQDALQRRPELKILDQSRKAVEIDLKLARNLRLPQLDFGITPGVDNGRGGADSLKTEIALTVPLRQRTADGRVEQARLKLRKLDLDLQLERRRIRVEVLDLANAVQQTDARHRAAEQELRLAQQLEEGERERFRLGDSTLFLVNQRERATAEAAVKVISLQAEYQQSLAAFRAASADL